MTLEIHFLVREMQSLMYVSLFVFALDACVGEGWVVGWVDEGI